MRILAQPILLFLGPVARSIQMQKTGWDIRYGAHKGAQCLLGFDRKGGFSKKEND